MNKKRLNFWGVVIYRIIVFIMLFLIVYGKLHDSLCPFNHEEIEIVNEHEEYARNDIID